MTTLKEQLASEKLKVAKAMGELELAKTQLVDMVRTANAEKAAAVSEARENMGDKIMEAMMKGHTMAIQARGL